MPDGVTASRIKLNEVLIEPEAWMLCLAAVTGARTEH